MTSAAGIVGERRRSAGLLLGLLYGPGVFGVTAAGVALSDIAGDLHIGPDKAVSVLSAHALGLGVGTAVFGRASDAWGVRRSLCVGAVLLVAGALLCVAATDLPLLVAGRLILACGSGATTSSALVLTAAGPARRRFAVLASFGTALAVFSAAATLAGGLTTQLSWRATVVLPALSILAIPWCLPLTTGHTGGGDRFDVIGAALLAAEAVAVLLLIQSSTWGLSRTAKGCLLGLIMVGAGALWQRVRRHPGGFVPRQVVGDRTIVGVAVLGAGVFGGLFAAMYAVPQILVAHHHFTVLQVGVALLPGAALGAALSQSAAPVAERFGVFRPVALSAVVFAAGLAAAGVLDTSGALLIAASLAFPAFTAARFCLTSQVSARVAPQLRGAAMGLVTLSCFVGGAVGPAVCAALWAPLGAAHALAALAAFPLLSAIVGLRISAPAAPAVAGEAEHRPRPGAHRKLP